MTHGMYFTPEATPFSTIRREIEQTMREYNEETADEMRAVRAYHRPPNYVPRGPGIRVVGEEQPSKLFKVKPYQPRVHIKAARKKTAEERDAEPKSTGCEMCDRIRDTPFRPASHDVKGNAQYAAFGVLACRRCYRRRR